MQSPKEQGKQKPEAEPNLAQHPELSEAWRALLGLQSAPTTENGQPVDPTEVQPQASDPWSTLIHMQGMETVDLQKIHLRALHPTASDEDIEHALNLMQEATNQSASQEKKSGEA